MVGTTYNIFFLLRFASHHLLSLRCFLSSSSCPSMRKHEMNKYYVCEISVAATKESARLQFTFACFSRSVNYHWRNEPFHGENKYLHRHRKWRKNLCTVSHTHTKNTMCTNKFRISVTKSLASQYGNMPWKIENILPYRNGLSRITSFTHRVLSHAHAHISNASQMQKFAHKLTMIPLRFINGITLIGKLSVKRIVGDKWRFFNVNHGRFLTRVKEVGSCFYRVAHTHTERHTQAIESTPVVLHSNNGNH